MYGVRGSRANDTRGRRRVESYASFGTAKFGKEIGSPRTPVVYFVPVLLLLLLLSGPFRRRKREIITISRFIGLKYEPLNVDFHPRSSSEHPLFFFFFNRIFAIFPLYNRRKLRANNGDGRIDRWKSGDNSFRRFSTPFDEFLRNTLDGYTLRLCRSVDGTTWPRAVDTHVYADG